MQAVIKRVKIVSMKGLQTVTGRFTVNEIWNCRQAHLTVKADVLVSSKGKGKTGRH